MITFDTPVNLPLHEWIDLLNEYSIDDLQQLIKNNAFDEATYRRLKPYLTDRLKNEEGKHFTDSD